MKPAVDIYLDGKKFAFRTWEIIPRVGDILLLRNGEIFAEVTCVFWGDDNSAPEDRQWVQIACKTVDREAYTND